MAKSSFYGSNPVTSPTVVAATSATSLTVGTGTKSFVTQTGLGFVAGQYVLVWVTADDDTWMSGQVVSYNASSGEMSVDVSLTNGSGSYSAWSIAQSGPVSVPDAVRYGASQSLTGGQKSQARENIGAVIGTDVQAYDAATLKRNATATLTVGYNVTAFDAGTKSSGTFTPDPAAGNLQYAINGGAHTLAAPASDCAITILYTNDGSAGTITFSGFTVSGDTGDALTTTDEDSFVVSILRINSIATYVVKALQ